MNYITEKRGGWDEWSEEFETIVGLKSEEFEVQSIVIDETCSSFFRHKKGYPVEVELPRKRNNYPIYAENSEYGYYNEFNSLTELEDAVKNNELEIVHN